MPNDTRREAERLAAKYGEKALFIAGERANKAALRNDATTFRRWSKIVTHLRRILSRR
jgi:hypothetical protein